MAKLNKEEIKDEAYKAFEIQEREKERKWDEKGQRWLTNRAK
jgi:hypothetical protein